MTRRIPEDAFAFYVALGADRSYQRVADHFNVSKNGILKASDKDNWGERLEAIEESVRGRVDERLSETMAEIQARHLKLLRGMAGRAAKAIQEFPLTSGMEGMRAAEIAIKLERLVAGEVSDRSQLTVEQVTRREIELLVRADDDPDEEAAPDESAGQ